MSGAIIQCECGVRTREPFLIGGRTYCAVCAEVLNPALVARKAHSWSAFGAPKRPKRMPWRDVTWD